MNEPSASQQLQTINDLLLYRLGRLNGKAGAMVVRLCEGGHGVTRREWGVIAHLREKGPLAPSALAEHFDLDRARTSRMIGSLVHKGLITRQPQEGNRRQATLALTEAGVQIYRQLMPQVQDINRRMLATLSHAEMAQLDDFLRRLHASADALRLALDSDLPKTHRRLGQRRP